MSKKHYNIIFLAGFILCFLLSFSVRTYAQEVDEIEADTVVFVADTLAHSAKIATLCSAIVPGLGQAYNGKYWKVPFIYSAFAALYFSVTYNQQEYNKFKEAYANFDSPGPYEYYNPNILATELEHFKEMHRRYRDLSVLGFFLVYVMNVVDASVDANLLDYDVSNDFSMHLSPIVVPSYTTTYNQNSFGLKLAVRF